MLRLVDDIPEGLYEKLQAERLILVSNMQKYGGSFVQALSEAILRSDPDNYERLKEAFPDYWETYSNMEDRHERVY